MDSLRWTSLLLLLPAVCCPSLLGAAQFSGQVRAADQIVPGATVTALQGGAKVTAFTDENGRYTLELTPGVWQIEVGMFEFTTAKGEVTVSDGAIARDWVLNMPRLSERGGPVAAAGAAPVAVPLPAAPGIGQGARGARGNRSADGRGGQGGQRANGDFSGRQGREGRGGQDAQGTQGAQAASGGRGAGRGAAGQAQPGFQSAEVRATPEGQQANAQQQETVQTADVGGDADESLLVNGSVSGGLEQSSDDEARRQRAMGGRGGPGGPGGPGGGGGTVSAAQGLQMGAGLPPGMSASLTNDSLGLGGFRHQRDQRRVWNRRRGSPMAVAGAAAGALALAPARLASVAAVAAAVAVVDAAAADWAKTPMDEDRAAAAAAVRSTDNLPASATGGAPRRRCRDRSPSRSATRH